MNNNFKFNLRKIRKEQGLTQQDLAKLAGITQQMVSRYETGVVEPSVSTMKKIKKALKINNNIYI